MKLTRKLWFAQYYRLVFDDLSLSLLSTSPKFMIYLVCAFDLMSSSCRPKKPTWTAAALQASKAMNSKKQSIKVHLGLKF